MGFLKLELDVIANSEGTPNRWWTAGTDMWREGRWIWITKLSAVEDSVWIPGQSGDTNNLNCLSLHPCYGYLKLKTTLDVTEVALGIDLA